VNAAWSWLFFHWHLGAGSFACIVVLWLMSVALIAWFARFRRSAALLLAPYLAWVTFASALNWTLWQQNSSLLL
jgi:benzodiazapine receptor